LKINKEHPVLVIGAGSIGERHINILVSFGFQNIFVLRRKSSSALRTVKSRDVNIVKSWRSIKKINFSFAIIANPTSHHAVTAIKCLKNGIHILVEKPLSNNLKDLHKLKEIAKKNNLLVYVGYMMRFHPYVLKIEKFIQQGKFGDLVSIESLWSEFLPDWHPWENYSESYAANKSLGGGAALTLSHDLDLTIFLANSGIKKFFVNGNFKSDLKINVEGAADILITFKNGITSNTKLSFHQVKKERYIKILFQKAWVKIDFDKNKMEIFNNKTRKINYYSLKNFNRNELFEKQLQFFINTLSEKKGMLYRESNAYISTSSEIINICNEIR